MEWILALSGNAPIPIVLNQIMQLANADAALIVRTSKKELKVKHLARRCIHEGKIWPSQPQTKIEMIIGDSILSAKAGSIWRLSEMLPSVSESVSQSREIALKEFNEIVVIPLESSKSQLDHLELQYRHAPSREDLDFLSLLASTLAFGWSKRTPGVVSSQSDQTRSHQRRKIREIGIVPILDARNPAALSRSEFRICAMMKEGMTVRTISESLSVCPTTVRSHLSSIFSKTGASSQIELLHLLNRPANSGKQSLDRQIV
ncbi:helix-turn-helix domain-containing protein [Ruegeria profundi]|uniref:helix-turn-helix domain-containing protein n=1 Tax=Ruegeria profundi TaxID=1685378 RepID=UPI0014703848|nr:helix-turn-helix transcriptional regulator [Ruegeria profundi]